MEPLKPIPPLKRPLLTNQILDAREYIINFNDDIYTLKIELKANEIFSFKIKPKNIINVYKYQSNCTKDELIRNLQLIKEKYDEPKKILTFFDTSKANNKLSLNLVIKTDEEIVEEVMSIKIIRTIDGEDNDYYIVLTKMNVNQEELLNLILEETKNIQKKAIEDNNKKHKTELNDIKSIMDK